MPTGEVKEQIHTVPWSILVMEDESRLRRCVMRFTKAAALQWLEENRERHRDYYVIGPSHEPELIYSWTQ